MSIEFGKVTEINSKAKTPFGFIHPLNGGTKVYFKFANGRRLVIDELERRIDFDPNSRADTPKVGDIVIYVLLPTGNPKKPEAKAWGYKAEFDIVAALCETIPVYTPVSDLRPQAEKNVDLLMGQPNSPTYKRYVEKRRLSREQLIEVYLAGLRFWDAIAVINTEGGRGVLKCIRDGKIPLPLIEDVLKKGFGLGIADYHAIYIGYGSRLSEEAMNALKKGVKEEMEFVG